jgi:hypothetical protein
MEKLWARHTELLPKLWDFQKQHFDRRQRIANLRYESKRYWATLATLYLDDAETNRSGNHSDIERTGGEQEWDSRATTQLLCGHCG